MKPQLKVDNPIHAGMFELFDAIQSKNIAALKAFGEDKKTDWMCTNYHGNNVFHAAAMSNKTFKVLLAVIPHDKKIFLLKQKNLEGKTPLDLLTHYGSKILIEEAFKTLGENALTRDNTTIDQCEGKTSHTLVPKASASLLPAPTLFQPKSIPCNPKHSSTSSASRSLVSRDPLDYLGFYIPSEAVKLERELGKGRFGTIYYGYWHYEEVAVKQSHLKEMSEDTLNEFKQEALMMARLRSNYIVTLKGICHSPTSYSLVMEYMCGGSLTQVLRGPEMLSWSERHSIAWDIAKGLAFLHKLEPMIIHRDIKSHNILLTEHKRAKLADFGFAMELPVASSSSKSCMQADVKIVGSLPWMAPECFDGRYSDKSDIYAYGMVLWEIVSRKPPYDDVENLEEIFEAVRQEKQEKIPDQMTRLESGNPTAKTPESIKDFIRYCWFNDAAKRPSADDAVKAFKEVIKKELEENNPIQFGNAV